MDRLDEAHKKIIPSDGVLLNVCTISVCEGDTAYDVLIKVCNDNGITVSQKSTVYGKYIAGLNGIDEKDCGKSSGWLYSVNGTYPPKACNLCNIKNGDKIVFRYSCG